MRVSYHADYWIPLPERHPFPMGKYPALHKILLDEDLIRPDGVHTPEECSPRELMLVHTRTYVERMLSGSLEEDTAKRIGVPWTPALARRARLAVQGTLDAAHMALEDGIAANLAGGTHHAHAGRGEGYCVFNDVAVAIRKLQQSARIRRALVVDLDVHQGNGTAAIFEGEEAVFTFSMHGEKNYPLRKERSSFDLGLPDKLSDDEYLSLLAHHLPDVIDRARPDLVIYLAGVDVVQGDRFGRLALTREGLTARDHLVLETVRARGLPILLVLAGGYARTPELTADLHAIVHREAARVFG
ncbi:MAG: histone deacetylase [Planctomycetes bacterium]|nr:histone deacetylase [Planctomycetota bacterium]